MVAGHSGMWRSPLRGVFCTFAVLLSLCQGELLCCGEAKWQRISIITLLHFIYKISSPEPRKTQVWWQRLCTPQALTLFQHANFEALGEAACLARLPAPLGDLALVRCRTAVLNVTWARGKTSAVWRCFLACVIKCFLTIQAACGETGCHRGIPLN